MTPELQRIAIAEACGWINQGKRKGVPALNHRWAKPDGRIYSGELPDYLNDLNASREMVLSLAHDEQFEWAHSLMLIVNASGPRCGSFANATAAQRAEAFLKTIGKWTP